MDEDFEAAAAVGPRTGADADAAAAGDDDLDAPSTSQQHHEQGGLDDDQAGAYGGSAFPDDLLDDTAPASDFHQLKKALMNERLAPEILAYQGELVKRVRDRIEQQVGGRILIVRCNKGPARAACDSFPRSMRRRRSHAARYRVPSSAYTTQRSQPTSQPTDRYQPCLPACPPHQEGGIDALEKDADGAVALEALSLERDRLRWLVKSYLRTRLAKVQQYAGARACMGFGSSASCMSRLA
jgi:hypothetical protein